MSLVGGTLIRLSTLKDEGQSTTFLGEITNDGWNARDVLPASHNEQL